MCCTPGAPSAPRSTIVRLRPPRLGHAGGAGRARRPRTAHRGRCDRPTQGTGPRRRRQVKLIGPAPLALSSAAPRARHDAGPPCPTCRSMPRAAAPLPDPGGPAPRQILIRHPRHRRVVPRAWHEQAVKKVPLLRGKTIVNLFFEASTRTRTTFELAAKRLSADVLNLNIAASSATKGETLLDTLRNLEAMHVRHVRGAPRRKRRRALHRPACRAACQRHQCRRRPPRPPHPGPAGHVHHPPPQGRLRPPAGGHRRRHPAFAGGALADPCPEYAGRRRGARGRPAHAAPRRGRDPRRTRLPRHARRHPGRGRGHDAAPATGAHAGRTAAERARILPALRPDPGTSGLRQAGRHRSCIPGPINRGVEMDSAGRRRPAFGDPGTGQQRHRRAHGGDGPHASAARTRAQAVTAHD